MTTTSLKIAVSPNNNAPVATTAHAVNTIFRDRLPVAIEQLKSRLQSQYEQSMPGNAGQIREIIRAAEDAAWSTSFPHLFLPELADEGIARLAAIQQQPEPALPRKQKSFGFSLFGCRPCAA